MKIWAHRGCSSRFPENTLAAFEAASRIKGITGIELDIQLTADGEMVVCHDEMVSRTTNGTGEIRSFSLKELKELQITMPNGTYTSLPTIQEVLDLLESKLKSGLSLNIELKTSVIRYESMEQKILDEIKFRGLNDSIVYSSFWSDSVQMIKQINPKAKTGMLARTLSECIKWQARNHADALHPYAQGLDFPADAIKGRIVRAWNSEPLFPANPLEQPLDMVGLEAEGVTDVFTNEPERYL
jgi:Glycerophosphoryl diester phosphodiesterase